MSLSTVDLASAYAYPDTDRQWLRTNFVTSLDGAAFDTHGRSGTLGGPDDRAVFALLRSLADVIIVGAATARTEKYAPVARDEVDVRLRKQLGLSPTPPIAIASDSLDIPPALLSPGQLVITHEAAPIDRLSGCGADVVIAGHTHVDWPAALSSLADRGFQRLLCEGGPTLHGSLIENDLVDELCLTISPVMAGGGAPRIAHGLDPTHHRMRLAHSFHGSTELLTRWVRERDNNG